MIAQRLFTAPAKDLGLLLALMVGVQTSAASPAPIEVLVDGKPLAPAPAGFRIPAAHKSVSIRLGTPAEHSDEESRRMRFKLEGVDNVRRQIPSEMSLMVRFGKKSSAMSLLLPDFPSLPMDPFRQGRRSHGRSF